MTQKPRVRLAGPRSVKWRHDHGFKATSKVLAAKVESIGDCAGRRVALLIGANALIQRRARERWTVAITDPSMVTIRNLVAKR